MAIYNSSNSSLQSGNKSLFEVALNNNESKYSAPFELAVARNKISGITGLSISGYSNAVSSTWIPLWELNTTYTYFNTAQKVLLWSDSASDTNVSVLINGLDSNYNSISETVILTNGVTGVQSSNSYLRINNISTTGAVNAIGNIRVGSTDKTITLGVIASGNGKNQMTIYTVPAGYTFYLTQVYALTNQNNNQYSNYRSWTQQSNGLTTKILQFPLTVDYNSKKIVPRSYNEKTDIQWQFNSSATSQIGAQIEGYLVSNSI